MYGNWAFLRSISKSVTVWYTKKLLAQSINGKKL